MYQSPSTMEACPCCLNATIRHRPCGASTPKETTVDARSIYRKNNSWVIYGTSSFFNTIYKYSASFILLHKGMKSRKDAINKDDAPITAYVQQVLDFLARPQATLLSRLTRYAHVFRLVHSRSHPSKRSISAGLAWMPACIYANLDNGHSVSEAHVPSVPEIWWRWPNCNEAQGIFPHFHGPG